jgi:hypothetical protein
MVYIPHIKAAFVEVPKTASRSVCSVLMEKLSLESGVGISHHATFPQYVKKYPDAEFGICVVREPQERLLSALNFMLGRESENNLPASERKTFLEKYFAAFTAALSSKEYDGNLVWLYPQYSFLSASAPLHVFTIDKIYDLLVSIGVDAEPPSLNVSRKQVTMEEVLEVFENGFIEKVYKVDFDLWELAASSENNPFVIPDAKGLIDRLKLSRS